MAIDPGRRVASAAALLALALGGCGGSSHASSTTSATSSSAAQNTTLSTSTAAHASHTRLSHQPPKSTHASTSTTTHTTAATSADGTSTAPPPTPPGTPAAPDGLRQVTGYSSYELCAGQCSGSVPSNLRRPLHLPHGCPASGGGGPVAPPGTPDIHVSEFIGSQWRAARVEWIATASYQGPILIRGRRTDAPGAVGFGEGHVPDDELQLLQSGQQAPRPPGGGRAWLSFTRVRGRAATPTRSTARPSAA